MSGSSISAYRAENTAILYLKHETKTTPIFGRSSFVLKQA